jgi:nitrogen regulatory protein PII
MKFKLIMALVRDEDTDGILGAARDAGATVVTSARAEGLQPEKTFLGLDLSGRRDLLLFLVAEQLSRSILETIAKTGKFEDEPGAGIVFQVAIEDAIGMATQMEMISREIEDQV